MDVSIIVTAYNYERYIESCIASCLNQDDHELQYEIFVIDDGSTDDTRLILSSKYLNSTGSIKYVRIPNSGIERACNIGFYLASGEYIVRVDADDQLLPNFLASAQKIIRERTFDIVYFNYEIIDALGTMIGAMELPEFSIKEIESRGDFLASGTLLRAKSVRDVGLYDDRFVNSGLENYDLILRMLNNNCVGVREAKPAFRYRRHSQNMSSTKRKEIIQNGFSLAERLGLSTFSTNAYHPYGLVVDS